MKFLFPLASRFIAGYNLDTAQPKIQKLLDEGYEVTIDYVGEESKTKEDVIEAASEYFRLISVYKNTSNVGLSIKPTQLGARVDTELCKRQIGAIAHQASKHNMEVRLDMEASDVIGLTIEIALENKIGVALQANHRSSKIYSIILRHYKIPVRLVKGAYRGSGYYNDEHTKIMFMYLAYYLDNVTIATHDEEILNELKFHGDFEMLYGIRRDLQKKLKSDGKVVRIYVPYGSNWFPYTLRRLKEWKNLKFVAVNMVKEFFRCTK